MSKMTGSKVSIDRNSSFARFALCRENNISQWTDRGFNTPIRQKEKSFWFTGFLVTCLKIISVQSPDTMTGQIHFSSVTFVILFFFHSNYPFFCVALGTLLFITTVSRFCKPRLKLLTIYIYVFFVLARCLNNQKEIPRIMLILK